MSDCTPEFWTLKDIQTSLEKEYNGKKKIVIPMFQRGKRWDKNKKETFIDSLRKKYPIGTLLFYKTNEGDQEIYTLIDGLQRGTAIKEYLANPSKFFTIKDFSNETMAKIYNLIVCSGNVEAQKNQINQKIEEYVKSLKSFDKNGYVIIQINLSNNTATLTKVEGTSFPTLTQQNLHNNGTIYQMAIAKYSKTTTSLTLDSTFKPNYIETPLSVASSGYQDAVKYVDSRYGFYTKKNYGTSNKCTIYLYDDEYNTYNSTIFFVKLSVGILVAIPGNGSSGMSNVTIDYVYGGANHTLVLGVSSKEKALIFTCNTTSHYVKMVYAYR